MSWETMLLVSMPDARPLKVIVPVEEMLWVAIMHLLDAFFAKLEPSLFHQKYCLVVVLIQGLAVTACYHPR
jgi:hypothetical protein